MLLGAEPELSKLVEELETPADAFDGFDLFGDIGTAADACWLEPQGTTIRATKMAALF